MAKKTVKKIAKPKSKTTASLTVKKLSAKFQVAGPKIIPVGARVLIKPFTKDELTEKNSFGIILPDSGSKEKSEQGKVIAVGAGEWKDGKRQLIAVSIGDTVAFSKYGYDDITVDGEEYYLIKEENILAILK